MNKGIIIIGKENSGKTRLSKLLAAKFKQNEIALIDGRNFRSNYMFSFKNCDKDTKCLIIDGINRSDSLDYLYNISANSIVVNRKHKKPIEIQPEKIIIVLDNLSIDKDLIGNSFLRRFIIIDTEFFDRNILSRLN